MNERDAGPLGWIQMQILKELLKGQSDSSKHLSLIGGHLRLPNLIRMSSQTRLKITRLATRSPRTGTWPFLQAMKTSRQALLTSVMILSSRIKNKDINPSQASYKLCKKVWIRMTKKPERKISTQICFLQTRRKTMGTRANLIKSLEISPSRTKIQLRLWMLGH